MSIESLFFENYSPINATVCASKLLLTDVHYLVCMHILLHLRDYIIPILMTQCLIKSFLHTILKWKSNLNLQNTCQIYIAFPWCPKVNWTNLLCMMRYVNLLGIIPRILELPFHRHRQVSYNIEKYYWSGTYNV